MKNKKNIYFENLLSDFETVSLKDMDTVQLMDRVDKKFAFNISKLEHLLHTLINSYSVLKVNDKAIQTYKSLYFDTEDRVFFLNHHNGRVNRHKVRFREYVGSGLVFLEVKFKNNKGKTSKSRIKVDCIESILSNKSKKYVFDNLGKSMNLLPQQFINFDRITFVDNFLSERLTIDFNLSFSKKSDLGSFENIVIAEIKSERSSSSSIFQKLAKEQGIFPIRLSKYCLSTIKLESNIKYNRFKEKLLFVNKLNKQ